MESARPWRDWLIKGRLISHLEMNNLIGDSQHGFRNKRSCQTSLLDIFALVIDTYYTDNNKAVDLVYLEFQKSFDKVPHERLVLKVNAPGIQGDAARWNRNWLAGRRQRVCINQSYIANGHAVTSGHLIRRVVYYARYYFSHIYK